VKAFIDTELERIDFLDESFYPVTEDTFYPSVTYMLESFPKEYGFYQWLKDVGHNADTIAQQAADAGTRVHEAINSILTGTELSYKEGTSWDEWEALYKFKEFYSQTNLKVVDAEHIVLSHKYKYGGRLDLVCDIGKQTWLIDYKFGKGIYKSYWLQLMAYKKAWLEMRGCKINKMGILHLKALTRKEAKGKIQGKGWQLVPCTLDERWLWRRFKNILDGFYLDHPDPKPRYFSLPLKIKLDIK
jgi:hypothetical protein